MNIIIIYLAVGTIWAFISENISNKYNKEDGFIEIPVEDPNIEFTPIKWTWELRIAFILTWPIGLYQFIKNLTH